MYHEGVPDPSPGKAMPSPAEPPPVAEDGTGELMGAQICPL